MKTSADTIEIFTALSKAQAEIGDAAKDATNPHFRSEYATLSSVLKEIRPVFSKHGLAIVQTPWTNKDKGGFVLTTMITHSSGQWISGDLDMLLDKPTSQSFGSSLSYCRRYSAASMAGVGTLDDDGVEASHEQSKPQKLREPATPPSNKAPELFMTDAKLKALFAVCQQAGWAEKQLRDFVLNNFGHASLKSLKQQDFDLLMAHLKAKGSAAAELSKG